MQINSLIYCLKASGIFGYVFIFFMFQGIPFLMPDLYLGLSFESSYKLGYKAMSLVHVIIPMLDPMFVIDEPFSNIILEEFSDYL